LGAHGGKRRMLSFERQSLGWSGGIRWGLRIGFGRVSGVGKDRGLVLRHDLGRD